ncbi:MAG: hypothetical protein AB1576_07295 [Bacillota bacterium]
MNSIEQFKKELVQLAGKSRYEIMTETTAIFTALIEPYGIIPVVVGGLAVEIYTRGQYTTLDIDLVMHRRELAGETLARLGFLQEGRHWYHPELEVAIEIPDDVLEGADREKIIKINLPSGRYLYVIGIEDIILDRLRACVHWRSTSDCEWGLRMLKVHYVSLDLDYMRTMAKNDHAATSYKLEEWLNETMEE